MAETAVVVLFPELEPLVGSIRGTLTRDGARGMPPHVTLVYPFAEVAEIEALSPALQEAMSVVSPFDVALAEVRRWPGVLYLAPDPPEPFVSIVERLTSAFPAHPPYGGAFVDIVPHVTIAQGNADTLDRIEREIAPELPVRVRAERAWVMADGPDGWRRHTAFPFGH